MSYDEDSCIRGYYLYQSIWTAVESLVCEREPLNSSGRYAAVELPNSLREGLLPDKEPLGEDHLC